MSLTASNWPGLEFRSAAGETVRELHRFLADVPSHHHRQKPGDHDDGAERAEDITDGISDGDVGLHGFRQVGGKAQFGDGIAGGAEDG